jgi:replicative DNA helicase
VTTDDALLANLPPQNIEAERAVLGALLLDGGRAVVDLVATYLTPQDFYRARHGEIYEAVLTLARRGSPVDAVTLATELQRLGTLESVGGAIELAALTRVVPSTANAIYYARLVLDSARLRRASIVLAEGQRAIFDAPDEPADEVLGAIEQRVYAATRPRLTREAKPLPQLLGEALARIEARKNGNLPGLRTGLTDLDERILGLKPGELTVLAARPSMGKSTLALTIARNVACPRPGTPAHPVLFVSLEMPALDLADNLLCSLARVDSHRVRKGLVDRQTTDSLYDAGELLAKAPLVLDDSPGLTPLDVRGRARRLRAEGRCELVLVDYLQLMRVTGGSSSRPRHEEVAEISRSLKALARELEIPVVALAQLNRNAEDRPDHRPRLSDLRESGSVEQDADVVILLHRASRYVSNERALADGLLGKATLIVAKNRNGPVGDVEVHYAPEFSFFGDLDVSHRRAPVPERPRASEAREKETVDA